MTGTESVGRVLTESEEVRPCQISRSAWRRIGRTQGVNTKLQQDLEASQQEASQLRATDQRLQQAVHEARKINENAVYKAKW